MYHSLFLALLKARHGWRFGVGPRNETIFSCLRCVSPQPSVYSLVIEVSIDPIASLYRQVIRSLSLEWKRQFVYLLVRNHVKLMRVINSRRGFSKGTVLCGGY